VRPALIARCDRIRAAPVLHIDSSPAGWSRREASLKSSRSNVKPVFWIDPD
jgi:hypothetical protein